MKENSTEGNLNSKDKKKMKDLLNKAKDILNENHNNQETIENNSNKKLSLEEKAKAMANLDKINYQLLEDESDFLTNTEKGTGAEIFFKTLVEEIPELGLSIEQATAPDGRPLSNYIAIKTTPFKTDRHFIDGLDKNQIISLFTYPLAKGEKNLEESGFELERKGILPKGMTERFLCRLYEESIKKHPDILKNKKGKQFIRFQNIEPLSDQEMQDLIRQAIREEYNKKI